MNRYTKSSIVVLIAVMAATTVLSPGAEFDPNEAFKTVMTWRKPSTYPPKMLHNLDVPTLSTMLDSGNLQWYEPRPAKDTWDGVVGLKVHAPPQVVWDVMKDYTLQCKIMKESFDACETVSRNGNEVKNKYKAHTSVIRFSYKFDIVDVVKEDPPYNLHTETVDGGLKGRQMDFLLVPVDSGKQTLLFLRYYPSLRSLGGEIKIALGLLPMSEAPVAISVANYHCRAYKNEAERRVGYKAPARPGTLDIKNLDLKTLKQINKMNGGLMRETPEGKAIDSLAYSFIDASPNVVWETATDFKNYNKIFTGSDMKVESTSGNTVIMRQKVKALDVMVFKFRLDLLAKYTLDPPYHLSYISIEGPYQGTTGDLRIMPMENGTKTLMFATAGINLDKDTGLVKKVIESGAFPVNNIVNSLSAQTTLAYIRKEAEKRAKK